MQNCSLLRFVFTRVSACVTLSSKSAVVRTLIGREDLRFQKILAGPEPTDEAQKAGCLTAQLL
jgi:hypothetical protein